MTSKEYAQLVGHAVTESRRLHEEAAQEFLGVPSPEPVDDYNREYDIAPWAHEGD